MKNLDFIARNALGDYGYGMERYEQFLGWAYWGWREVFMDQGHTSEVTPLSINEAMEADLPNDFVDWVSVYYESRNRKVTFVHDSNLAKRPSTVPEKETCALTLNQYSRSLANRYLDLYGPDVGRRFGGGTLMNSTGYFNVDYHRKTMQFNAVHFEKNPIMLEYISNNIEHSGNILVHEYAVDMVRQYIHWQRAKFSRTGSRSEAELAKRDYDDAKTLAVTRFNPVTVKGVIEAMTSSRSLSPRTF